MNQNNCWVFILVLVLLFSVVFFIFYNDPEKYHEVDLKKFEYQLDSIKKVNQFLISENDSLIWYQNILTQHYDSLYRQMDEKYEQTLSLYDTYPVDTHIKLLSNELSKED